MMGRSKHWFYANVALMVCVFAFLAAGMNTATNVALATQMSCLVPQFILRRRGL